jgi:hypothetical protein
LHRSPTLRNIRAVVGTLGALGRFELADEERVTVIRKFVDSDGVNWQVYELTGEASSSRRSSDGGDSWLYFFSRDDTRSLAAYPDDWAMMDWPGLDRLCHRAQPPVQQNPERSTTVAQRVDR